MSSKAKSMLKENVPGAPDGGGGELGSTAPPPAKAPGEAIFQAIPIQLQLGSFMAFSATSRAKRNQFVWRSRMKEISIDL